MRKRTGLRNRLRTGVGTYHTKHKNRFSDQYATHVQGYASHSCIIAGHPVKSVSGKLVVTSANGKVLNG